MASLRPRPRAAGARGPWCGFNLSELPSPMLCCDCEMRCAGPEQVGRDGVQALSAHMKGMPSRARAGVVRKRIYLRADGTTAFNRSVRLSLLWRFQLDEIGWFGVLRVFYMAQSRVVNVCGLGC